MEARYIPESPVHDVRNEIYRLAGIVDLLAFLTGPECLSDTSDFEMFNVPLADLAERLAAVEKTLSETLEKSRLI